MKTSTLRSVILHWYAKASMARSSWVAGFALLCIQVCCTEELLKWWKLPEPLSGRLDSQHHSPRCCTAEDCLAQDRGRKAFVSSLRSPEYLILLKELHCSIVQQSPSIPFIVLSVAGDLNASIIQDIQSFAEYREVEEFSFPNEWFPRFSKNWAKLRAWNFTDVDALIMLDSDIVLQGSIEHLFALPTDFAWVTDAGPGAHETHSGGLIFLRPCQAVAEDMLKVVKMRPELRQPTQMAEQAFLAWYFRYAGMRLSSLYNTNFEIWYQHTGKMAAGGGKPLALHFSDKKMFAACPSDPEWQYLCHRPKLLSQSKVAGKAEPQRQSLQCASADKNAPLPIAQKSRQGRMSKLAMKGTLTQNLNISRLQEQPLDIRA